MERQAENSTGKTRVTFSQKWGDDPFTQSGHTQVPNALISYAHRLGLRSEECWLITCILRFKYDASNPTPSQELLAELFGQSVDTVQRTVRKIVEKKMLKVERIRDEETQRFTHTVYDFTPLRFALNECHYQDHPEERPRMPVIAPKPTPQKCGLESETHTAEMRPGSTGEPHRRSAAWATPQICGLYKGSKKNINDKEKEALNVRESEDVAPDSQRPTLNGQGRGLYAIRDRAVEEIVALTGDEGSRRRFEQLWEMADRGDALDAWTAAKQALQRRLRTKTRNTLDRPGAYFDAICVRELENREIFVPTSAEKLADEGVAAIVKNGLFGPNSTESAAPAQTGPQRASEAVQRVSGFDAEGAANDMDASPVRNERDLVQLEQKGGAPLEAFNAFVAERRRTYEAELGGMRATARERLLAAFDRPEKRQNLYRTWVNFENTT